MALLRLDERRHEARQGLALRLQKPVSITPLQMLAWRWSQRYTYHTVADAPVELLEHLRLALMPLEALALPLCDRRREVLHDWQNVDEVATGDDCAGDTRGVRVDPLDDGLVLAADPRPPIHRGQNARRSRPVHAC